jgi:c-di-GMP-related signal transduction protein
MHSDTLPYCIALQPICNARLEHVADELLYRSSAKAGVAEIDDQVTATARVCNAAFYETGVEALCGTRKLFFNAPREWLLKPELLPPDVDQVVIEVLESVEGDPEVLEALKELKARGYTLALDDFVLTEATRPLLDLADIIKLDLVSWMSIVPEALHCWRKRWKTLTYSRLARRRVLPCSRGISMPGPRSNAKRQSSVVAIEGHSCRS